MGEAKTRDMNRVDNIFFILFYSITNIVNELVSVTLYLFNFQ